MPAELHLAGVALARGVAVAEDLDWIRLGPCSLEHAQQRLRWLRARDAETTVEQEERNAGRAHLHGLGFLLAHLTSELVTVEHTTGVGLGDTDITRQLHQRVAVTDRMAFRESREQQPFLQLVLHAQRRGEVQQ